MKNSPNAPNSAPYPPILFVGDLHLGAIPKLSASKRPALEDSAPVRTWHRCVDFAIDNGVQAVVMTGDVVHNDKDRYQAWRHLKEGAERLVHAGISVFAIAGNHDYIALPKLTENLPAVRLIGRNTSWERVELQGVDLFGWSYASREPRVNPLAAPEHREGFEEVRRQSRPQVHKIGILHGDLDPGTSQYAHVRSSELAESQLDAWFLGHIHIPSELQTSPVGYLGSVSGLNRKETGRRGPWLVSFDTGKPQARQLLLSPLRWEEHQLDVGVLAPDGDDAAALQGLIHRSLSGLASSYVGEDFQHVDTVALTLRLVGHHPHAARLNEEAAKIELSDLTQPGSTSLQVVKLYAEVEQAADLRLLSEQNTPLGSVASMLLRLDEQGLDALPKGLRSKLSGNDAPSLRIQATREEGIGDYRLSDEQVARRALNHILRELLEQQAAQSPTLNGGAS